MKDLLNGIKNLLGYRKGEAIGFMVLTFILLLVTTAPFVFGFFITKQTAVSPRDVQMLDSLVQVLERQNTAKYFYFNPNTISDDSMKLLKLSPSVNNNWRHFLEKGGHFYKKEDFKKIYGLKREDFDTLRHYLLLPHESASQEHMGRETKIGSPIDINKVTAKDLVFIRGIGDKLSTRIIKYRDLLGGYVNEEQFNNVYFLEGEALNNLKDHVFIADDFIPKKINLNTSLYKGIIKHPYIDKELANGIFAIRHSADSVVTRQKLKDLLQGKDSLFSVLLPYVDF